MPRRYSVSFENISCSVVQDLLSVKGAAGKVLRIIDYKVRCVDTTAPANTQLALRCTFLPATVTDGTGGATVTPRPLDPGDAAASFTARRNDITTQGSTNGTKTTMHEGGGNVYTGDDYTFPAPPIIGPSETFVLDLFVAPAAALKLSGNITVEELGG